MVGRRQPDYRTPTGVRRAAYRHPHRAGALSRKDTRRVRVLQRRDHPLARHTTARKRRSRAAQRRRRPQRKEGEQWPARREAHTRGRCRARRHVRVLSVGARRYGSSARQAATRAHLLRRLGCARGRDRRHRPRVRARSRDRAVLQRDGRRRADPHRQRPRGVRGSLRHRRGAAREHQRMAAPADARGPHGPRPRSAEHPDRARRRRRHRDRARTRAGVRRERR